MYDNVWAFMPIPRKWVIAQHSEQFQWWKIPFGDAAVCSSAGWDHRPVSTMASLVITLQRDQLQTSYNNLTKDKDQLQNSFKMTTTEKDQSRNSLNATTTERDQLQIRLRFCENPCLDRWWKISTSCYVSSKKNTGGVGQAEYIAMGANFVIINSGEDGYSSTTELRRSGFVSLKQGNLGGLTTHHLELQIGWKGNKNNMNDKCVEISQAASDPWKR